MLRRGAEPTEASRAVLEAGPVRMDIERHVVSVSGVSVRLPFAVPAGNPNNTVYRQLALIGIDLNRFPLTGFPVLTPEQQKRFDESPLFRLLEGHPDSSRLRRVAPRSASYSAHDQRHDEKNEEDYEQQSCDFS